MPGALWDVGAVSHGISEITVNEDPNLPCERCRPPLSPLGEHEIEMSMQLRTRTKA